MIVLLVLMWCMQLSVVPRGNEARQSPGPCIYLRYKYSSSTATCTWITSGLSIEYPRADLRFYDNYGQLGVRRDYLSMNSTRRIHQCACSSMESLHPGVRAPVP